MSALRHMMKRAGSQRRRAVTLVIVTLLSAASAELGARAFWSLRFGTPFLEPDHVLYAFYPGLQDIDAALPSHDDAFFDILFLGGSVLHRDWGSVEQTLLEQLAARGHRNVRIFNLATPAHTSRDSRLKYAALGAARFDLVVFYHGINDSRVNNAPPEIFREDYSHYSWYETVNAMAPYHGTASFALPYTVHYLSIAVRRTFARDRLVPTHEGRAEWLRYGGEPRSAASFKNNLNAILMAAAQRSDPPLLMSFATYLPKNYSRLAFKEKRLDYGLHLEAAETWGLPEHVMNTVAVHNNIIRELADQHPGVRFVDQAALLAGNPRFFNDPCHLTSVGSLEFVQNMLEAVLTRFPSE